MEEKSITIIAIDGYDACRDATCRVALLMTDQEKFASDECSHFRRLSVRRRTIRRQRRSHSGRRMSLHDVREDEWELRRDGEVRRLRSELACPGDFALAFVVRYSASRILHPLRRQSLLADAG
jgi:hypothetical protein